MIPLIGISLLVLCLVAAATVVGRRRWRLPYAVIAALVWIIVIGVLSLGAEWLPLPEARDPSRALHTPSLLTPGSDAHLLGTDSQGLDILGGVLFGARVSIVVGLVAVLFGGAIGGFFGMLGAFVGRRSDRIVQFVATSVLAFPPLILLMGLAVVMSPSIPNVALALGVVVAPIFARISRGATISVRDSRMVESSVLLGASPAHTLRKDIVPLVFRPVLAYALVAVSMLIVAEASLSYLGLGVPRPSPTLGNMISSGQDQLDRAPHVVFAPAVVLFLIILSLNVLGEHVQERLR